MNVYIETNFILEQSYLQEQQEWCERILELGEAERIQLVIPAFCIGEAYGALVGRNRKRTKLHDDLATELKELARSKPYSSVRADFFEITKLLTTSGDDEKRRLDTTILRVANASTLITIDQQLIRQSMELQLTRNLSPQDSLVYASVLSHLNENVERPRCFVTKNSKDFSNPDIETELSQRGCLLFTGFGEAFGFLRNQ